MKKILLTFVAFFAMMTMALAQTLSWTSADWTGVAEKAATISFKAGDFTLTADKVDGQTNPTVNGNANDLRIYALGSLNIASTKNFKKLVFNLSNKKRLAEIAVNNGQVAVDKEAWTLTWTGDANNVTFTVGEKNVYGTDPTTKAGQFCIASIVVGEGGGDVKPNPEPQPNPEEKVVFAETFETSMGAFTVDNKVLPAELTEVWKHDAKFKCMKASAFDNATKTKFATESWLVSPVIDLTKETEAVLSFENAANFFGNHKGFVVKVKVEGADWTDVVVENMPDGKSWTFVTSTMALKPYAGKKIQLAFVYSSTTEAAGTWEIKNLKVAAKGGDVKPEPQPEAAVYTTIAELKKNAVKDAAPITFEFKDLLVVAKANKDIYVTDGKEATLFFTSDNTLNVGDKISGKVKADLVSYWGLTELKNVDYTEVKVVSQNNEVKPLVVTLAELAADGSFTKYESMLVAVKGVKVEGAAFNNKNINMTDGTNKVTLRDNYNAVPDYAFDVNETYDFTGVIGQFKNKTQVNLLNAEGIQVSTGIEAVEAENGAQVIYDLSGRRVAKAVKGLYIVNGKKVYVK